MTLVFEHLPESLTKALQNRALREGRSVQEIALDALLKGLEETALPKRDLSDIAGTLSEEDARIIEENVKWMDEGDLATQR